MPNVLHRGWFRVLQVMSTLLILLGLFMGTPGNAAEWTKPAEPVVMAPPPPVPTEFITVEGVYLQIHGRAEDEMILRRLAQAATKSIPRLADEMDVPIGDTIHVFLAESDATFRQLQPGKPPMWADATAYPGRGAIYLRHPRARGMATTPLEKVLDHEIVHVLLGRAFAPTRPPSWLQEGLAQVMAKEYGPQTTQELAKGMLGRDLYSLEALHYAFPDNPHGAHLAYAQSADLIAWMQAEYGEESSRVLIRELMAGASVRGAVRAATGEWIEDVDTAWRDRLEGGIPLWWSAALSPDSVWFATAVLALFAVLVAHLRNRRRLGEIREQERIEEELLTALARPRSSWQPGWVQPRGRGDSLDAYHPGSVRWHQRRPKRRVNRLS